MMGWLFILFAGFFPETALSEEITFQELKAYYDQVPGRYIREKGVGSHSPDLKFWITQNQTIIPEGAEEFDHEYSQSLFETDVDAYTHAFEAPDFLEAKSRFYSSLPFNPRLQAHSRPYGFLNGWLSLNHPPIRSLDLPLEHYTPLFSGPSNRTTESTYFDPKFQSAIDEETGTELSFGNTLTPLFNGDSIKEKTLLVKSATRYVLGAVMAIACDESSQEFIDALIDKAKSGIPVKIMMEGFYGRTLFRPCANRLRRNGVDVVMVNEKWKRRTFLSFFHIKFWIRDGEEAIIGGQNIVKYQNLSTGFNQLNRDTDLKIKGPAVTDLLSSFLDLWDYHAKRRNGSLNSLRAEAQASQLKETQSHLRGRSVYEEKLQNPETRMKGACRMLVQNAYLKNLSIAAVLEKHVKAARQSVILTSPEVHYTPGDEPLTDRDRFYWQLKQKAKEGVQVEFISNGVDGGNGELTAALRTSLERAIRNGNRLGYHLWHWILSFEPRNNAKRHREYLLDLATTKNLRAWTHFNYIHAKQAYFDRIVTSISSVNLDTASMARNEEAGALCMDESLSAEMEKRLTLDLVNSVPVMSSNELSPETIALSQEERPEFELPLD